ncbi:MAG TPA: hypothetical protein VFU31_29745 [Candidatus Binatia bacterium]|nr:hypothetical protein [Candidatus Binatia bacterium]
MRTYETLGGQNITDAAAEMVKLAKLHGEPIKAVFNGIHLVAYASQHPDEIVTDYWDQSNSRREEWIASPEGQESERRRAEGQKIADQAKAEGILPFDVANQPDWDEAVKVNTDDYGSCGIRYAARWANYMEREMASGHALEDIAKRTSDEADKEGITGFMYGCAVSILSQVWKHGEALRRWHNLDTQIGDEGEKANETGGVLNPALLNIGAPS